MAAGLVLTAAILGFGAGSAQADQLFACTSAGGCQFVPFPAGVPSISQDAVFAGRVVCGGPPRVDQSVPGVGQVDVCGTDAFGTTLVAVLTPVGGASTGINFCAIYAQISSAVTISGGSACGP